MKKLYILFLISLITSNLFSITKSENANYYLYNGQKVYLNIDKKKIIITGDFRVSDISNLENIDKIDTLYNGFILYLKDEISDFKRYKYKNDRFISYMFSDKNHIDMAFTSKLIIKLKSQKNAAWLYKFAKMYRVKVVKWDALPNHYLVELNSYNYNDYFKLLRILEKEYYIDYVAPNFNSFTKLQSNDTYFNNMWHLKNTGQNGGTTGSDINIEPAWNITNGSSSIKIAVIDIWGSSSEFSHSDLNMLTAVKPSSLTFNNNGNIDCAHGIACAGIIGATINNNTGVVGICNQCQILPIKIGNFVNSSTNSISTTTVLTVDAINLAISNNADIISASLTMMNHSTVDAAISNAFNNGRGGKGILVVTGSGNNNSTNSTYPSSNSLTLSVGAMSMCNERKMPSSCDGENWWGGNYGGDLDVSAPGVNIYTTDIEGNNGYNTQTTSYCKFNGTSAACPIVAGIAGLCLSINSNLTATQLRQVIESTCSKVGGYSYSTTKTNGTWSNDLGYGRVNAYAAVQAAQNLNPSSNDNCSQATQLTSNTSCTYQNFSVSGATESSGFSIPSCSGTPSVYAYDVWFKFTAQASSHTITVDPEGTYSGSSNNSYVDPIIAVYSACSNGSLIQCEDDAGGGGGNCNITLNGLTVGTTYYIRVYDYSGGSTVPPTYPVFGICVTHTASTTCPNPTGTNEASIQTDNIRYDWDDMSGATNGYSVRYRSGSGSWITFPSPNSFLTVSGYTCNTNYEWEVRTECASSSSDWSSTRSATTSPCPNSCGVPQNMQTTNITATSANLNIGNSSVFGAVGYEFRYRVVGSTSWTTLYTTATAKDISGLTCNTNYEWQMRTDCGNGLYSSFTNIITFTTQNCATQSIDLTKLSDNITFNPTNLSITHSLVNNGTANSGSFGVTYVLSKSSTFSTIDYTLGTENVNGLNASSNTQINKSFDLCSANIENGSYYFGYYIDKNNVIAESNENNNFWSLNTSTLIDCRIDLVSTNSRFDLLNDVLTFDMGIQNTGNIDVQNAKVSFYLSRLSNFSSLDVHLGDEILPQVSGNSDPVRFKKPFNLCNLNVPTGDYYIGFVIDKDNTIKEIDEKNTYSAKDAVYYECGTSSIQIAGNFNSEISIYPNPTTGDIFISNILKDKLVEIYSIEGKKVKETLTKDRFNISDLDNGTFIIKIDGKTFKVSLNK